MNVYDLLDRRRWMDRWDREGTREEVVEYLRKNELIGNGDVLIFGPEADDCLVDIEDLLE